MKIWEQHVRAHLPPLGVVPEREREIVAELAQQLEQAYQEALASGATEADASTRAEREIGDWAALARAIAAAEAPVAGRVPLGGGRLLSDLLRDLRHGLRQWVRNPGFTAVVLLTLALGIGANTAIFSVVNGILIRPLPFAQPSRLVSLTDAYPEGAFAAMRRSTKTMDVAAYREGDELNLTGLGEPERLYGTEVSANFFSLLGARPERGRVFVEGEDQPGRDRVVILSHGLWQESFGSDPNVIGRSVALDGVGRQIVGVMPADFRFGSPKAQFWVPLDLDSRAIGAYWGGGFMPLIGRLRAGATPERANAEFRQSLPRLRALFPWRMPDALWAGASVVPLQENIVGDVQGELLILLGAVGAVLLIACANVANLLLARAATRHKEMAVRSALGAGRWRICRQLLIESLLLGVAGGALGLLLAAKGLSWLKAILPADTPRLASISIDGRVMAFTAVVAILTGLLFGVVPALHASRIDLTESLKTGWQHSTAATHRWRNALAIAEMALAVVLVIGAGLLVKSLWELAHVKPGFRAASVVTARITPNAAFCADFGRCQSFYGGLLARVRALPGVEAAAIVNGLPLDGRWGAYAADIEGHPRDPSEPAPVLYETVVSPDYFRVMGIPLLRGRGFGDADMAPSAPPVALVTGATARKYWPGQDPIGKHVKPVFDPAWTTVVGVVGDVAEKSLASRWPAGVDGGIYEPFGNGRGKLSAADQFLVVKTAGEGDFGGLLRKTVASSNPEVPVSEVKTLRAIVSLSVTARQSIMWLFVVFAALALALGAVGIYGVVAYSVTQRTPEIGVRMALGAQRRDVLRLVIGQGARLATVGVTVGIAGALAVTRLMASLLYGVGAADPGTYIAVAVLMVCVVLLACYLPARRAMRVDPMVTLRCE